MKDYTFDDYILSGLYFTLLLIALPFIIIGFLGSLLIEAWHVIFS